MNDDEIIEVLIPGIPGPVDTAYTDEQIQALKDGVIEQRSTLQKLAEAIDNGDIQAIAAAVDAALEEVRDGVDPERDTLAKLSAAIDARLTFSTSYASDAAAAQGGVPIGGLYRRTTGEIAQRMALVPTLMLSGSTIPENASIGAQVGTLSVDAGSGTYVYSLTDNAGGRFTISGTSLRTAAALDYETGPTHNVTVQATNSMDAPITRTFTVNVADVSEDTTPDDFSFSSILNAQPSIAYESNVVTFTGLDAPALVVVAGGEWRKNGGAYTGSAGTVVNGNTGQVRGTSSHLNSTTVGVSLTVGGVTRTFQITTPASAGDTTPPVITSTNAPVVEENAQLAHTLAANEAVTWTIIGGQDASRFEIVGSTLRWAGNVTRNYEAPVDADGNNAYVVTIRATDGGGNTADQTITATVTDVAEAAAFRVIWDTDQDSDIDDVVALALLLDLMDTQGTHQLVAATVNSANAYAAHAMRVLLDWADRQTVPVGWATAPSGANSTSQYTQPVSALKTPFIANSAYPTALSVLRTALAAAPDASVKIVCGGQLTNLAALLASPADGISSLTGAQLVAQKAVGFWVMAGRFPQSTVGESNAMYDYPAANYIAANSPIPVYWAGYEIADTIFTKIDTTGLDAADPYRVAWAAYGNTERASWDSIPILHAVLGLQTNFTLSAKGDVTFNSGGYASQFIANSAGRSQYVIRLAAKGTIAAQINGHVAAFVDRYSPADTTAPTITSSPAAVVDDGQTTSGTLTANEPVTWTKSGTHASSFLLDPGTGAWSLIGNANFTVIPTYFVTWTATDADGNTASQNFALTVGGGTVVQAARLVEYMLDAGAGAATQTVADSMSALPLTLGNSTTVGEANDPTWIAQGLRFDGGDRARSAVTTLFDTATTFIAAVAIKRTGTRTNGLMLAVGTGGSGGTASRFFFRINGSTVEFIGWRADSLNTILTSTPAEPLNEWSVLIVSVDGTAVKIYRNGVEIASGTMPAPLMVTPNARLLLGGRDSTDWIEADIAYAGIFKDLTVANVADVQTYVSGILTARLAGGGVDVTAPTITSTAAHSVNENAAYSATATANEVVTWTKSGPDAGLVTLNATTGAWSIAAQDYETKPSVAFTLTATDAAGNAASQNVTVTIGDVNEAPPSVLYFSTTGSDANDGLTSATPKQTFSLVNTAPIATAGTIYLKGGDTFNGQIVARAGLTYSSYGTGRASVRGVNPFRCEVNGVTVDGVNFVGPVDNTGESGVYLRNWGIGTTIGGFTLRNATISGFQLAGVYLEAYEETGTLPIIDGVLIEDVVLTGNGDGLNTYAARVDGIRNLTIRRVDAHSNPGKTSSNPTGSGIALGQVKNGLVEYCRSYNNGGTGGPWGNGNLGVGVWMYDSADVTVRYCESYGNKATSADGGGFDIDGGCSNCVIEYCYSHDNMGPGLMLYQYAGAPAMGTNTIRFCLSKNDGTNFQSAVLLGASTTNNPGTVRFHNNTIWSNLADRVLVGISGAPTSIIAANNVFVHMGSGTAARLVSAIASATANSLLVNNAYWAPSLTNLVTWGSPSYATIAAWRAAVPAQETFSGANRAITVDPLLVNPSAAGNLSGLGYVAGEPAGLALQSGSTLSSAALNLTTAYSIALPSKDYFNGTLSGWTVGADSTTSVADTTAPTITSAASVSVAENTPLSHALTANEAVTWTVTGGADAAKFEVSGSTLRFAGNAVKDYEAPDDADSNLVYAVQVTATDAAGNATPQTISVTLTDVAEAASAQRVIYDTDWGQDADDSAGLALLLHQHTLGNINLLGVINTIKLEASAEALRAGMALMGYSSIPLYSTHEAIPLTDTDVFATAMRAKFGDTSKVRADFPESTIGYRTLLAAAPNASVRLFVVGGLTSLYRLMLSPADGISGLTGMQLVTQKVTGLWYMGTRLSDGGPEHNARAHPAATAYVFDNFPHHIHLIDGDEYRPMMGPAYLAHPDDPLSFPHQYQLGNDYQKRHAWDPITIVLGLADILNMSGRFEVKHENIDVDINASTGGNQVAPFTVAGNKTYWKPTAFGYPYIGDIVHAAYDALASNKPHKGSNRFYFAMNEGSGRTVTDEYDTNLKGYLGTGRLAATSYAPTWVTEGLDFATAGVVVPVGPSFVSQNFIVGVLIAPDTLISDRTFASMFYAPYGDAGWTFKLQSGSLALEVGNPDGANFTATAPGSLSNGTWRRIIVSVENGVTIKFWRDGVQVGTTVTSTVPISTRYFYDNPIILGGLKNNDGGGITTTFDGKMAAAGVTANLTAGAVDAAVAALDAKLVATGTAKGIFGGGGDTTAPTITSASSGSIAENTTLAFALTANETVTWSIVGGPDAAKFEISGSTLRWVSNGTKDFEVPDDSDTNGIYSVTVRATDTSGNTADQTVNITVTNVTEGGGGGTDEAETTAYVAAMSVAPDTTRKGHINTLVAGLKADGVWSKLDWLCLLAAHDAQAARLNLKNPAKSLTSTVMPTFTVDRGFTGDVAATAHFDFGEAYNAAGNNFALNSASMGYYINQTNGTGTFTQMGSMSQATRTKMLTGTSNSAVTNRFNSSADQSGWHGVSGTRNGFHSMNRVVSTNGQFWYNGTKVFDVANASSAVATGNISLFKNTTSYSPDRMGAVFTGGGLTDAEMTALHSRVTAYLTAIGANA